MSFVLHLLLRGCTDDEVYDYLLAESEDILARKGRGWFKDLGRLRAYFERTINNAKRRLWEELVWDDEPGRTFEAADGFYRW